MSTFLRDVTAAFRVRVADVVTAEPDLEIGAVVWGGFDPGKISGRWLRISVALGAEEPVASDGTNARTELVGVCFVEIYIPAGDGEAPLLEIADAIADAFRGWHHASPQIVVQRLDTGRDEIDGARVRRLITVEFRAYVHYPLQVT